MPGLLEPAEEHDLHEAPDMERRRGRIEADIAGHHLFAGERIERGRVGHLVNIAA